MFIIEYRDFNDNNLVKFRNLISEFIEQFRYSQLTFNNKCTVFCTKLLELYDKSYVVNRKCMSTKRTLSPWLTASLLRCVDRKHELRQQSIAGLVSRVTYQNYRNNLLKIICKAKRDYYSNIFLNNVGNTKDTWKNINRVLKPNGRVTNDIALDDGDGHVISDPVIVSNEFNNYFSTVAGKLRDEIPPADTDPLGYVDSQENSFLCLPTNVDEVIDTIIDCSNKKGNIYSIPGHIYKQISDLIAPVLSEMFNYSISNGIYPDFFKKARVVPIHKADDKHCINNYRPISTLHFLNKVFEKLMYKRLICFLDHFNILYERQFGFLSKRSTADAMLQFTDEVYNTFNNNKYLIAIYLDFSKAFDTVDHNILLGKLNLIGVRGVILSWFKSYLCNRSQFVSVSGAASDTRAVEIGVPQGSVLGPLLFLIYINDMWKASSKLTFVHFADDTTVYSDSDNLESLIAQMNDELKSIDSWLIANKLSLNLGKSKCMIFSNRNKVTESKLFIRDVELEIVKSQKFLGVLFDDDLTFKNHVDLACKKLSRSVGVIRRLANYLPNYVLNKLYFSLVYPYLSYCVVVWGSSCRTQINRLINIQDRCIDLLSDHLNVSETYFNYKLLKFLDIYKYFTGIKFYEYYILGRSLYFFNRVANNQILHDHNTRNVYDQKLNFPKPRISKFHMSFIFQSIVIWNDIPLYIRKYISMSMFKSKFKQCLLSPYMNVIV